MKLNFAVFFAASDDIVYASNEYFFAYFERVLIDAGDREAVAEIKNEIKNFPVCVFRPCDANGNNSTTANTIIKNSVWCVYACTPRSPRRLQCYNYRCIERQAKISRTVY